MGDISERTKIGLFPALAVLPVLATVCFFVALIYFKAEANDLRNVVQDQDIKEQRDLLKLISERTARMEAILERIEKK